MAETPAHAWPGDSVGYLVWRSYLVFRRAFDDGLTELDVTMAQVGLAGELMVRGPRTVADLARIIGMTPQGAALAVAHLRKIGWVTQSQARGRGRSILLEITDKGRDGYLRAAGIVEQVDKALTGGLTATERKGTLSGLKLIADTQRLPARTPAISYRAIEAAMPALSDSLPDTMGIDTSMSHALATTRERPRPSEPTTSTIGPSAIDMPRRSVVPSASSPATKKPAFL
jgi:DNA-binding MarR family transcriptional regulator